MGSKYANSQVLILVCTTKELGIWTGVMTKMMEIIFKLG